MGLFSVFAFFSFFRFFSMPSSGVIRRNSGVIERNSGVIARNEFSHNFLGIIMLLFDHVWKAFGLQTYNGEQS